MKKIEIKNRLNDEVLLSGEYESIKDCLEKNTGTNLSWANLCGADLSWANLSGADLSGTDLAGTNLCGEKLTKNPLQIIGLKYWVMILEKQIKIGCEVHNAEEWEQFDDETISKMDSGALEWWKTYKPVILGLWKEHVKK
jgi:hypothetical protein